jgi:hypothetical protein
VILAVMLSAAMLVSNLKRPEAELQLATPAPKDWINIHDIGCHSRCYIL